MLLRIKLVKSAGSDPASAEPNIDGCVNYLLHSMISSRSDSLNGKPVLFTRQTTITKPKLKSF